MVTGRLTNQWDFAGWRTAARGFAQRNVAPADVVWTVAGGADDLFAAPDPPDAGPGEPSATFAVPRAFVGLAEQAILHADPERFGLLYELLWRLRSERGLMEVAIDPLVSRLQDMAKAVRRDIHKMHAFVRFREVATDAESHFVAWFEPDHHIVEAAAPFFQRRFAIMRWSILTPDACAHWDCETLFFTEGVAKPATAGDDAAEDLWRRYYAAIFNPARLKVGAMRAEMPQKYWRNLPEAQLIKPLIDSATKRTNDMVAAAPTIPKARRQTRTTGAPLDAAQSRSAGDADLDAVRRDAAGCRACPLWEPATQTVFGEGPPDADIVFVGEQPGDQEDLAGRPFVGPAGQLFDRAMAEAGVDRSRVYVTNAVKHFKFEPRGKRRLHKKPNTGEIQACRWWLARELDLVKPKLVVAMGATAVQAVLQRTVAITQVRGSFMDLQEGTQAFITVHPSYLLRLPDETSKAAEYRRFVTDLQSVAQRQAS